MKKIRNIKQLRAEKKRLREQRKELEKSIKTDWRELKESFRPGNFAEEVLSGLFRKKEKCSQNGFIVDSISGFAGRYARKMFEKAGDKITEWFRK